MIESHFIDIPKASAVTLPAESSMDIMDDDQELETIPVTVKDKTYDIMPFGKNNQLPYVIREKVGANSVMSQNKFFNLLTCYSRGLEYMDISTVGSGKPMPTRDSEIRKFLLRNSMKRFFAEQIVDLKYYFFCVSVVILDRQRKNIVKIVHKDACHCRFEKRT